MSSHFNAAGLAFPLTLTLARSIASHLQGQPTPEVPSLHLASLSHYFLQRLIDAARSRPSSTSDEQNQDESAPVTLDLTAFARWPEGVLQEQEALLDWYEKLKFIYLELDTKRMFLEDTLDEPKWHTVQQVDALGECREEEGLKWLNR